jgi:hypothetical protein
MIDQLNVISTSAQLRLLAAAIEADKDVPDFFFGFIRDGVFYHAHRAEKDVFGLTGLASYVAHKVREENE